MSGTPSRCPCSCGPSSHPVTLVTFRHSRWCSASSSPRARQVGRGDCDHREILGVADRGPSDSPSWWTSARRRRPTVRRCTGWPRASPRRSESSRPRSLSPSTRWPGRRLPPRRRRDRRPRRGYVMAFVHPTFFANGPVCWVEELMVAEDQRGRGIGRALVEHVETWAASADARLVALATRRASHFYRRSRTRSQPRTFESSSSGGPRSRACARVLYRHSPSRQSRHSCTAIWPIVIRIAS
jgi:GNAT superfamily N-acetyltransferase